MSWPWATIAIAAAALGVDRAGGYSTDFADRVRGAAGRGGWYGGRRNLQIGLSVAGAVLLVGVAGFLVVVRRRIRIEQIVGSLAVAGLIALRLVRTISLHDVDVALRTQVVGIRVATLAETALLAAACAACAFGLREKETFP